MIQDSTARPGPAAANIRHFALQIATYADTMVGHVPAFVPGFFIFDRNLDSAMPSVRIKENEYFDAAMRRFKRACEKAGVLTELRRREFYEKPAQERKRKKAAAVKRHLKRMSRDIAKRKRLY